MEEQLVDILSLVAKYEKEMDRIEDLVLTGALVSSADREAWRRWVNNSSSSSGAKMKKKKWRKRKLPKTAAVGGAVLRRARGVRDAGNCGFSAVAVHQKAGGRACCAATRLGERSWCASATDHGTLWRRIRLCVSSWSRLWCASTTDHGGFGCAADHGGNRGGDSAGDKVVDMLVIVQRQVLGETEQKIVDVPQLQLSRGRPVLGLG